MEAIVPAVRLTGKDIRAPRRHACASQFSSGQAVPDVWPRVVEFCRSNQAPLEHFVRLATQLAGVRDQLSCLRPSNMLGTQARGTYTTSYLPRAKAIAAEEAAIAIQWRSAGLALQIEAGSLRACHPSISDAALLRRAVLDVSGAPVFFRYAGLVHQGLEAEALEVCPGVFAYYRMHPEVCRTVLGEELSGRLEAHAARALTALVERIEAEAEEAAA